MRHPFRYFSSPPEVIRLSVMLYIRCPLSLRQIEDIFFERGINSRETFRQTVQLPWPSGGNLRQTASRIGAIGDWFALD